MASVYHDEQKVIDGIHIPYAIEFANEATRNAATGLVAADVGKFARQMDDNSVWMLVSHLPIQWLRISFDALHAHDNPTIVEGEGISVENDLANNQIIISNALQAFSTFMANGETLTAPSSGMLNIDGEGLNVLLQFDIGTETALLTLVNPAMRETDPTLLIQHSSTHEIGADDEIAGLLSDTQITKLDGISEAAEVNQNAFSSFSLNGQPVVAKNKTDTMNLVISGAAVNVNDASNTATITITSTGGGTSSIHASTHLEGGSDAIPLATSTSSGLMSSAFVQKLASIESNADENIIESIQGSGYISATKTGKTVIISSSLQQSTAIAAGITGQTLISPTTSGSSLYFKRLAEGSGISLTADNDKITISSTVQASTSGAHAALHQTGGSDAIPVVRASSNPAGALDGLMASANLDELVDLRSDFEIQKDVFETHKTADEHWQYSHISVARDVSARHTYRDGAKFQTSTGDNAPLEVLVDGTSEAVGALIIKSTNPATRADNVVRWGIYAEHASYGAVIGVVPKGISYAGMHARVNSYSATEASCYHCSIDDANNLGSMLIGSSVGKGSLIKIAGTNTAATHAVNVATAGSGHAAYFTQNGTGRGVVSVVGDNGDAAFWAKITAGNTDASQAYLFYGEQQGLGGGIRADIGNTANDSTALYVRHYGTGWLADLTHMGSGRGLYVSVASGNDAIKVGRGKLRVIDDLVVGGKVNVSGKADFIWGSSTAPANNEPLVRIEASSATDVGIEVTKGSIRMLNAGNILTGGDLHADEAFLNTIFISNGAFIDDELSVGGTNQNSDEYSLRIHKGGLEIKDGGLRVVGNHANNIFGDLGISGALWVGGSAQISGTLTKGSGTFLIDHPLDPLNKSLSHSFVESPDMKNIYDGIIKLDGNGEGRVELPSYFEALNENFRYQLTAIGTQMFGLYISEGIKDGTFIVSGGRAFGEVSWQVTGSRKDKFAKANPVIVEQVKATSGYIHPELFN